MNYSVEIPFLLLIIKYRGNTHLFLKSNEITNLIIMANNHKVNYYLMIFAHTNKELFTKEQINYLNNYNKRIAAESLKKIYELKKITEYFKSSNIVFLCVKGPQLSHMLYGNIALKESVDLDILLSDANKLNDVNKLLFESGYTKTNLNQYPGRLRRKAFLIAKREIHYFNPVKKCAIDLHIRPGANTYITKKNFSDFFEDIKLYNLDDTLLPVLPDEHYLVYLCYHGALHQFSRLAWLLDIKAFLVIKGDELNIEKVISIAKKWKVERCVGLALILLESYFDYKQHDNSLSKNTLRLRILKNSCRSLLFHDSEYGLSLRGRISKIIYVMILLKGFFAKTDWLYGVFMRKFIALIAKKINR